MGRQGAMQDSHLLQAQPRTVSKRAVIIMSIALATVVATFAAFSTDESPKEVVPASRAATLLVDSHCEKTLSPSASSSSECRIACQAELICGKSRNSCSSSFVDSGPLSPRAYCTCRASGPCTSDFECRKELPVSGAHDAGTCNTKCSSQPPCQVAGTSCTSSFVPSGSFDPVDRCNCYASGACTPDLLPDSCSQQLPDIAGASTAAACQTMCSQQAECNQTGNSCASRFVASGPLDPRNRCYCTVSGPCNQ